MFYDDEEEFDGETRLVKSTKGEYDVEENVLRPKTLEAYVGQSKVKRCKCNRRYNTSCFEGNVTDVLRRRRGI